MSTLSPTPDTPALIETAEPADTLDAYLRRHKEANAGRGVWEHHACARCDDGRKPDRCPATLSRACEYLRAVND